MLSERNPTRRLVTERRRSDAELDDLRARYAVAKKIRDDLSEELRDDDRRDYDAIWELYKAAEAEASNIHWPIMRELQLRAGEQRPTVSLPDSGHYPDLVGDPEGLRGASDPVSVAAPSGFRHYVYDRGRVHLFQRVVGGLVVSGLAVVARRSRGGLQSGVIDRVNTLPAHRRRGYAAELLRYARSVMREVRHSKDLTSDGRAWKSAVRNPLADSDDLAQRLYDASFPATEIQRSHVNLSTADRGHPVVDEPERYRWFLIREFPVQAFGLRLDDLLRDAGPYASQEQWRHDKIVDLLRGAPAWPAIVTADGILVDGFHRVTANRTLRRKTMPVIVAVERSGQDHWDEMWLEARREQDS